MKKITITAGVFECYFYLTGCRQLNVTTNFDPTAYVHFERAMNDIIGAYLVDNGLYNTLPTTGYMLIKLTTLSEGEFAEALKKAMEEILNN